MRAFVVPLGRALGSWSLLLLFGVTGCCRNDADPVRPPEPVAPAATTESAEPEEVDEDPGATDEPDPEPPAPDAANAPAITALPPMGEAGVVAPDVVEAPPSASTTPPSASTTKPPEPERACAGQGSPCSTAGIGCCPGLKCCALTRTSRYCQLSCR